MIPTEIKREQILKAIEEIEKLGVPKSRCSRKYGLEYDGKIYPPKYVLSLANRYVNGTELDSSDFSGGNETNEFLRQLGFAIVSTKSPSASPPKSKVRKMKHRREIVHNERCLECKETIKKLLEKIYEKVEINYKFDVGVSPEYYKDFEFYEDLKNIYGSLQRYRNHLDFTRAKTLPNCDFFIPDPGFILEFDESQHFTKPREITLEYYPKNLETKFDRGKWTQLCKKIERRDNDPPYRDEQRAWYDTLRDFLPRVKNLLPTVRLYASDKEWCKLNPKNEGDIRWFKEYIDGGNNLRIGLAFPELKKHDITYFQGILEDNPKKLDLVIFPEAFETIFPMGELMPKEVEDDQQYRSILEKYLNFSKKIDAYIIVGLCVEYGDDALNGGGDDQYCLFVSPVNGVKLYHKHTTSKYTAFFDENWSIESNFPVVEVKGVKVGVSVCHDSYVSLIPRILKKKGSEVWVNISYRNVKPSKWEPIHQTRAVENHTIAVCTLHRDSNTSNEQKEPYAFSESGKIILKDIISDGKIEDISLEKRTGRIFYLDTQDYETYPTIELKEQVMSPCAELLSIDFDDEKNLKIFDNEKRYVKKYVIKEVTISEFLHFPERLWAISLENKGKIVFFVVYLMDEEWMDYENEVEKIIKGRVIEFSTLYLFSNPETNKIHKIAYQSSGYKASRIFSSRDYPIEFDKRYIYGLNSTTKISLDDARRKNKEIFFERVHQIINFLRH